MLYFFIQVLSVLFFTNLYYSKSNLKFIISIFIIFMLYIPFIISKFFNKNFTFKTLIVYLIFCLLLFLLLYVL